MILVTGSKLKVIVDEDIPFIKGRLEKAGIETVYTNQWGFAPELVRDADAILIRTRTRADSRLLAGSKVRLVATATIGMDQIDTEWCEANNITVRNAPGCNAPGVAQYVWSSLLRLGFDPCRHTLGVIGCGNVGSAVCRMGEELGARLLVSDPPKGLDCPLDRLLAESDAVTLHTPLTKTGSHPTFHLIGKRELELMRPGSLLVNAARGPVVDFDALKTEVLSSRIRAVIDTWEGEPDVDRELLEHVEFGTYHIAGYSLEGKQRATRMVLEALEEVFGIDLDKSGLEGVYEFKNDISASKIIESYNPEIETGELRKNPDGFDRLRADYRYRHEV